MGVKTEEAIFTSPLLPNGAAWFALSGFKKKFPLMVMSYLGSTKTWLYAPIFAVWDASAYSLRLPALLIGAASLFACYSLLRRTAGEPAASLATALLACDSSYLMATTLDWDPVAIQHLCFLGQ